MSKYLSGMEFDRNGISSNIIWKWWIIVNNAKRSQVYLYWTFWVNRNRYREPFSKNGIKKKNNCKVIKIWRKKSHVGK